MKTTLLSIIIASMLVMTAQAETTSIYMCKVGAKAYPLKINDSTITWRGTVYQDIQIKEGCKQKLVATNNKNGDEIEVCTATKGYADVTLGRARFYCEEI
jgi:hypothetical protein